VFLWGLASAGVMVLGSIGPWLKVRGLATINGTDDGHDGWVVLVAAAVGAVAILLSTRARPWFLLAALAAGVGLATTIYDRVDLEGTAGGVDVGRFFDAGWGLYAAMVGSGSLAVAAAAGWIVRGRSAFRARGAPR
jgi:4-hydroxybenzoate polyprenyltransferase